VKTYELSDRLKKLPPYLFAEIDKKKTALKEQGIKFIDLSVGDPDISAPESVIQALSAAASLKENQKYALDQGKLRLRQSIKNWTQRRFDVTLDENKEIMPLIGSKEGLVHFPLAFVNKGEYVIYPSPGYPGYRGAATLAEAKIYQVPLKERNSFIPELSKIPLSVKNKAKLIYLN